MAVPTYDKLMNPTLQALKRLGGSGSVQEIEDTVIKLLNLSDKDVNEIHRGNRTKLGYRLAWARNYLKRYGLLENSIRGVWALTPKGTGSRLVNESQVRRLVKRLAHEQMENVESRAERSMQRTNLSWEQKLIEKVLSLNPSQFERLCQRLLRESEFTQVEVTGRSGDGGIDGRGVMRIGGFLNFRVIFQCKRYAGSVRAKEIRDFRGAMVGRADRALFMTTGRFTREAQQEAVRDGAPPIDLMDGQQLALKMKELGLGIKIAMQEVVEIDPDWFGRFKS